MQCAIALTLSPGQALPVSRSQGAAARDGHSSPGGTGPSKEASDRIFPGGVPSATPLRGVPHFFREKLWRLILEAVRGCCKNVCLGPCTWFSPQSVGSVVSVNSPVVLMWPRGTSSTARPTWMVLVVLGACKMGKTRRKPPCRSGSGCSGGTS